MPTSDFVEHLHDVFSRLGPIRGRRMFGGWGIYHDEVMFGLVADDTLYLKVDRENAGLFDEAELPPFVYRSGEKSVRMSYRLAPEAIFDDPDEAAAWGRRSWAAGLRAVTARAELRQRREGAEEERGSGRNPASFSPAPRPPQ